MADTVKTIGSGGDYADPILWSAAEGNVNDGNRAVGELISDVTINALFRPNQTFPNGGLLRGDTALTGEVGIGRTLTNTAGSRVCLSPNPILEFQDLWISDGGVAKSSTFQNMSGNDFTRVISYDAVTGGTISVIADTTSTTLDNCVFYSIVQGNSSVAGSVTVNNSVIIERMVVRVNNLLTFLNSISLATDWYLGRPTDSGAESLVNYCYIKENANANEFGSGSSNNTLNTDSTSDLVNVALKDYRTGSASPQATGNGSGGLIGAFLEVSGGVTVTALLNSNYMVEYSMKKNVASQSIGAQMVTISDGSDFTGTVTAEVTIDNGTKTAGAGSVTHEGEGYHSYAPTQAETNGDHIAVSFAGTGALTQTIQVYTTFPQTVDNDTKISLIPTTAMRGTDSANTVVPPSVAQFNARTIVSADYFAPAADTVANVTLVATTTTNTDMRGTDSALLTSGYTAPDNAGITQTQVDIAALNDIAATDIVTAGAITTSSGNASVNIVKINGVTIIGDGSGTPFDV